MKDLIDRQAAIAYAISGRIRTLPTSEDGENWIRVEEVRESLLNVPSTQPEIIRCSECKHRRDQSKTTAWLPCRALIVPDDFSCIRAERREE